MIDLSILLKVYLGVLAVVVMVGPCWLTYANVTMNYGWKKGMLAMSGCMTIELLYWIIGVTAIGTAKSICPDIIINILKCCAAGLLLHLAHSFWNTDVAKIKASTVKGNNLSIYLKLVALTLTSPQAIVGYASIYASIEGASNSVVSILLGSALASFSGHTLVVSSWALIGKKINNKMLTILNRVSGLILVGYAGLLVYDVVQDIIP